MGASWIYLISGFYKTWMLFGDRNPRVVRIEWIPFHSLIMEMNIYMYIVNALGGREFMAIMILPIVTFNEFNVTRCDTLLVDVTPRLGWTMYILSVFFVSWMLCFLIFICAYDVILQMVHGDVRDDQRILVVSQYFIVLMVGTMLL